MKTAILSGLVSLLIISTELSASPPFYDVEPVPVYLCDAIEEVKSYNTGFLQANWPVVLGENGWLLNSKKDLDEIFGLANEDYFRQLQRFVRALEAVGTKLMIVYTPTRGLVSPQNMNAELYKYNHSLAKNNYIKAAKKIKEAGVFMPRMDELIPGPNDFFPARDLHWTPAGSELVAKLVAEELERIGFVSSGSDQKFEAKYTGVKNSSGIIQKAAEIICGYNLPVNYYKTYTTVAVDNVMESSDDESALFSESDEPFIALVGTSYSANEDYNFAGFLQQYSNTTIANYSVIGGNLIGGWSNLLKSDDYQESHPEVVIWEMPSYYTLGGGDIFSQLTALSYDGCRDKPALLKNKVNFKAGGIAEEALFSSQLSDVPIKNLVLDFALSDRSVSEIDIGVWLSSGVKRKLSLKVHSQVTPDGRFIFELGNDAKIANEGFIALDIERILLEDGAPPSLQEIKNITVDVSLCETPYPYPLEPTLASVN